MTPTDPNDWPAKWARLEAHGAKAAEILKLFGHEGRLSVLAHLATGERTVSALSASTGIHQATVSQNLAKLRAQGLVLPRRDGKEMYYRLADPECAELVALAIRLFCRSDEKPGRSAQS